MNGTTKARLERLEQEKAGGASCGPNAEADTAIAAARAVLVAQCGGGPIEAYVVALTERVESGAWTHADGEALEALRACGVDPVAYLGIMRRLYLEF
jgi:energy-converting hydrogenase Eha subunit B